MAPAFIPGNFWLESVIMLHVLLWYFVTFLVQEHGPLLDVKISVVFSHIYVYI